jgi:hypothetical protein
MYKSILHIICVENIKNDFFCVGAMYPGEYDACDVTLSAHPHQASLKNMPDFTWVHCTNTEKS